MSESISTIRPTNGRLNEWNWAAILWRRKWIVVATLVVFVAVTAITTTRLTRIYSTSATLIVAQPGRAQSIDNVQSNEEAARSYANILASPTFAEQVARVIGGHATGQNIQSAVTIQPVAQTLLLKVSAENSNPAQAKKIADTYAAQLVKYAPKLERQTKTSVTLADAAPVPASPSRPRPLLYGLVAAMLGFAAGIMLAFLRERFDIRIRSLDELTARFDFPLLADIPVRSNTPDSMRAFAEAFRLLQINLRLLDRTGLVRSIAVTSWSQGEGKSTLASQFALSLAATGTQTLIIDGDAYRPSIHALLGTAGGPGLEPGLTDYALGKASAAEAIHRTRVTGLDLMPPGRHVQNLSSLLESPSGRRVFSDLPESHGIVVVDCPPLAAGADAPAIASRVDGVILVVDLGTATTRSVSTAIRQLDAAHATVLGVAANRDPGLASLSYSYAKQPA